MMTRMTEFRKAVKAAEQETLGMLADLFDWLDRLEPQPTAATKKAVGSVVSNSLCLHTALESYP